jgi:hypothetical protein
MKLEMRILEKFADIKKVEKSFTIFPLLILIFILYLEKFNRIVQRFGCIRQGLASSQNFFN